MAQPTYAEFVPAGGASDLIRCEWVRTCVGDGVIDVLPDGCVDIVWRSDGELFVAGPDRAPVAHHHPADVEFVGVRLRPGTSASVLGVPVDELCDRQVPLSALWGRGAGRLAERLMESTPGERRRVLVEAALARALTDELDAGVLAAVSALEKETGAIADLEDRTGLSSRQLRRRFVQQVGYGPKTYQRVIRFRRFLALARTHRTPGGLAGLAAVAGYSDQAHLTRECRRFSGRTPTQIVGDRFVQDGEPDRSARSPA